MTYEDLQNEVVELMSDVGNVSGRTFTRVGQALNRRYRAVLSAVGLPDVVRQVVTATTTIGNRDLVFDGLEKVFSISNPDLTPGPNAVLRELSYDELLNTPLQTDPARYYAIKVVGASSVTVRLSSEPATAYDLDGEGEGPATLLRTTDVPAFAEDFHDVLVSGALADVLLLKNPAIADVYEAKFNQRVSDLRYFLAKSRYKDIRQGKHPEGRLSVPLANS